MPMTDASSRACANAADVEKLAVLATGRTVGPRDGLAVEPSAVAVGVAAGATGAVGVGGDGVTSAICSAGLAGVLDSAGTATGTGGLAGPHAAKRTSNRRPVST